MLSYTMKSIGTEIVRTLDWSLMSTPSDILGRVSKTRPAGIPPSPLCLDSA